MNLMGAGPVQEIIPRAKVAAERALQMDNSLSQAHYVLAMIHFNYDWDFPGAEREFNRALQLEANSSEIRTFHGFYLSARGRHDEAVEEMQRALRLDPLSLLDNRNVGSALYYARRYDEAIKQFEDTASLDPNYPVVYNWLTWTYMAQGMDVPAVEWEIKGRAAGGLPPAEVEASRALLMREGARGYWQKSLRDRNVTEINQLPPDLAYHLAAVEIRLGKEQDALRYLQKALAGRSYWMAFLNIDPKFDPLRRNPRFQDLLRRITM